MELETITRTGLAELKGRQAEVRMGKETVRGEIIYDELDATYILYREGKKPNVPLQPGQKLICGNEAYILGEDI